jgi:hypothetical protein
MDHTGSGTINSSLNNTGAVLSPGNSPGTIVIAGDYWQGPGAAMLIELAGAGSGLHDLVRVLGTANLGGTLEVALLDGLRPGLGDTFHFLDFAARNGQFNTVEVAGGTGYEFNAVYSSGGVDLVTTVVPEPATLCLLAIVTCCLAGSFWWLRKRQ